MRECGRLGTTQPSFEVAARTLARLGRVSLSSSTVWRYHKEVTGQLETELEEEQNPPPYVRQEDLAAMEWVAAHERIEKHASVSIDGVKVLLRDDGYREVKIVSVSEVVKETETEAEPGTIAAGKGEADSVEEDGQGTGCQKGIKLKRHSYRAILGDKESFIPILKGELACRRVWQADKISAVNDGARFFKRRSQTAKHRPGKATSQRGTAPQYPRGWSAADSQRCCHSSWHRPPWTESRLLARPALSTLPQPRHRL